MEAITTPGHTANHMSFAFKEADLIFAGDHVMGWSTTIVAPPDGAMSDYMASLHKLARRTEQLYLSGHGMPVRQAQRFVRHLIEHRQAREASILHRLRKGAADIPTIVKAVYIGLDPRLTGAAALSVLAHLEDMVARGEIATEGPPSITGTYRLADAPLPRLSGRRRRLFLLRLRRRQNGIDIVDEIAHARRIGAEIVAAVARRRTHVDARAVRGRADAHHDVVAEAEDRRARHRLDDAVARGGCLRRDIARRRTPAADPAAPAYRPRAICA